jgi:hypothetical protein
MTGKTEGLQYSAEYLAMKAKAMRDKAVENRAAGVPVKLKVVTIDAQFPELKGANQFIGRGQASTIRVAGARAFAALMKEPKLKRKQISRFTAVVSFGTKAVV